MHTSLLTFGLSLLLLWPSALASSFCNTDACFNQVRALPTRSVFCHDYERSLLSWKTTKAPSAISACTGDRFRIFSACICVQYSPSTTTPKTTSSTTIRKSTTSTTTTRRSTISSTTTTLPSVRATTTTSQATSTTTTTTRANAIPSSTSATTTQTTLLTITRTTTAVATPVSTPASRIYNKVGNGNFVYDASAPGGLAAWIARGNAKLVYGNAYHGDGNTGNYAVQLTTGAAALARRVRRQTANGGAAGIEQILVDLSTTSQYTVSLWYYVDYTLATNTAPENCRIDAYYGSTLFSSTPYFAANTGQTSQWVQFVSTVTPSTSSGNLLFSLNCINSGTAESLISEVFVSNQATPYNINNISLDYSLAPATSTTTSTTAQGPSSVASSSIAPPNHTCSLHIVVPFPSTASCQKQVGTTGSPDELYIYGNNGISNGDCAAACLKNPNCKSFSWGPMSGAAQCILYPQTVGSYAVAASSSSGLYVWDRACWTYYGANSGPCVVVQSSTTSTKPKTTATVTLTTTPVPVCTATACSTTYPVPASTCENLLPNPSPACNAVCGAAGAGIQNVYEAPFSSIATCQLGCVQSATCKSWAFQTLCQFSDQEFLWSNVGSVWSQLGNGEKWFDNQCFFCAGDAKGSSCATTTTSPTTTPAGGANCPTQLVVNPSFETFDASNGMVAPWSLASFSSLQGLSSAMGAVDGAKFVMLNPGFVRYTYGPGSGQPDNSSVTQSISCFDVNQTYTVDFYWYVGDFCQSQGITTTTCSVYVQVGGSTVFTTTFDKAGNAQPATWHYNHNTANFVPLSETATLLVGADCGGNEGFINVDLIQIYPVGSNPLAPDFQSPPPP
ncbi:hypothetical protein MMC30_003971 [Trapelia coarctata]|nr:hypothetical protein [Trapelia coarctata]